MKKQEELKGLKNELYCLANKKMSRREALSTASKIAIAGAGTSLLGGLFGYFLGSSSKKEVTKTLTETEYVTITRTETETQTLTKTVTTTKTETPIINIQVKIGKSYNPIAKDYAIGIKVISPELDHLKAYYENASFSGVLDEARWFQGANYYSAEFLSGREIGRHRIKVEVEKDGSRAEKDFYINIGLDEGEISSSSLAREELKLLWRTLLEDSRITSDREELLRLEYDMANAAKMNRISEHTPTYLKDLANAFLSLGVDYRKFQKGTSLLLRTIDSRPWVCFGNFTENMNKADFPLGKEELYLLSRILSEVDLDEEHVYAARGTIDQLRMVSLWLQIDPFDVVEHEGEKLQLWGLTKELLEKQLKYEEMGMRRSMRDVDLVKRWGLREGTNNRHIYYGLRQAQLPAVSFTYNIEEMAYAYKGRDYPWGDLPKGEVVNLFKKFVDRYDKLVEFLNYIVSHPETKLTITLSGIRMSPQEYIRSVLSSPGWKKYYPNSIEESYKDCFQTLLFNGSLESRAPMIMYAASDMWNTGYEEGRVEGGTLLSSYLGYPTFRFDVGYPANTDRRGWVHGEISFVLNKEDENKLYERSKDELFLEKTHTYSLPFVWTRKPALLKDQEEKGRIEDAWIYLPLFSTEGNIRKAFLRYEFSIDKP
jgi:hypothetical protein